MITSVFAITQTEKRSTQSQNPTIVAKDKDPCNNPWSVSIDCEDKPRPKKHKEDDSNGRSCSEFVWTVINGQTTPKCMEFEENKDDVFRRLHPFLYN